MNKTIRYATLLACVVGLNACYVVQPAPNSQIVIQNPQR